MKCLKCDIGELISVTVVKDVASHYTCGRCGATFTLVERAEDPSSSPIPHLDLNDVREVVLDVVTVLDGVISAGFRGLKSLLKGK